MFGVNPSFYPRAFVIPLRLEEIDKERSSPGGGEAWAHPCSPMAATVVYRSQIVHQSAFVKSPIILSKPLHFKQIFSTVNTNLQKTRLRQLSIAPPIRSSSGDSFLEVLYYSPSRHDTARTLYAVQDIYRCCLCFYVVFLYSWSCVDFRCRVILMEKVAGPSLVTCWIILTSRGLSFMLLVLFFLLSHLYVCSLCHDFYLFICRIDTDESDHYPTFS